MARQAPEKSAVWARKTIGGHGGPPTHGNLIVLGLYPPTSIDYTAEKVVMRGLYTDSMGLV